MRHSANVERYLKYVQTETSEESSSHTTQYSKGVIETLEWVVGQSDARPIPLPEKAAPVKVGRREKEKSTGVRAVPKPNHKKKPMAA